MTRKDFEAAAAIIRRRMDEWNRSSIDNGERVLLLELAADFADMFSAANPRFDRRRFLDACGV